MTSCVMWACCRLQIKLWVQIWTDGWMWIESQTADEQNSCVFTGFNWSNWSYGSCGTQRWKGTKVYSSFLCWISNVNHCITHLVITKSDPVLIRSSGRIWSGGAVWSCWYSRCSCESLTHYICAHNRVIYLLSIHSPSKSTYFCYLCM